MGAVPSQAPAPSVRLRHSSRAQHRLSRHPYASRSSTGSPRRGLRRYRALCSTPPQPQPRTRASPANSRSTSNSSVHKQQRPHPGVQQRRVRHFIPPFSSKPRKRRAPSRRSSKLELGEGASATSPSNPDQFTRPTHRSACSGSYEHRSLFSPLHPRPSHRLHSPSSWLAARSPAAYHASHPKRAVGPPIRSRISSQICR
jgi:hypothetical protein